MKGPIELVKSKAATCSQYTQPTERSRILTMEGHPEATSWRAQVAGCLAECQVLEVLIVSFGCVTGSLMLLYGNSR